MSTGTFHAVDYVVFGIMLLISAAIGIYHGCIGGKQQTTGEYLLGNRNMGTFPMTISLLVTFFSGITLLGVPGEIFTFGTQYSVIIFAYIIVCAITATVFVPIFYGLDIISVNEYLEMRFDGRVRVLVCILSICKVVLLIPIVLYVPSLALEAVAGVPITATIISTGIICIFYTTIGGFKAVVWADVFQAFVMFAGLVTVFVVGTVHVGGFTKVWEVNRQRDRLNFFNFDSDPTVRNTFWTVLVGGMITNMVPWTISQAFVQRFLASKSLNGAQRAAWFSAPGLMLVVLLCCLDGLVIFAVYADCDLIKSKKITSNDQILPYFVIDKLGHLIGIPGLFISCIFSGALSTVSSALNAVVSVTLEDLVKKKVTNLTDRESTKISKILALVFGIVGIALAFLVKYAGVMVLQLTFTFLAITGGPCVAIFLLGMLVPRANSKGVCVGFIFGVTLIIWIIVGAKLYPPDTMPGSVSIKGCSFYNASTFANSTDDGLLSAPAVKYSSPLTKLYSLSYLWYTATAAAATFVVGALASIALESEDDRARRVRPELLFHIPKFFKSLLPGNRKSFVLEDENRKSFVLEDKMAEKDVNNKIDENEPNDQDIPLLERPSPGLVQVEQCSCQMGLGHCKIH